MLFKKTHIFSESSKSKLSNAYQTKMIAWEITEIQAKQSKVPSKNVENEGTKNIVLAVKSVFFDSFS